LQPLGWFAIALTPLCIYHYLFTKDLYILSNVSMVWDAGELIIGLAHFFLILQFIFHLQVYFISPALQCKQIYLLYLSDVACIKQYFWQTLFLYLTFGLSYISFSYMSSLFFTTLEKAL
jgi:hypothetical protein